MKVGDKVKLNLYSIDEGVIVAPHKGGFLIEITNGTGWRGADTLFYDTGFITKRHKQYWWSPKPDLILISSKHQRIPKKYK